MAHLKETKLTSECIYDGRIVRLERDTQLVVPAYDYCMPEKNAREPSRMIHALSSAASTSRLKSFSRPTASAKRRITAA